MSQLVSNMYLLMITALLLGWFIGWFIRRSATRSKYTRILEGLEEKDRNTGLNLHKSSSDYENNAREIEHTKNKMRFNENTLRDYQDKKINLVTEIDEFNLSQKKLEKESKEIGPKMENSLKEIEVLESYKDEILGYKKTITETKEKLSNKEVIVEKLKSEISELETHRESSNSKVLYEKDRINLKEQDIEKINDKIRVIEDEFKEKSAQVIEDEKSTKIKALNYKYALNYANEKMQSNEPLSYETIDKIVSKNEETGIFENIIKKLFSKSAKYILGGK